LFGNVITRYPDTLLSMLAKIGGLMGLFKFISMFSLVHSFSFQAKLKRMVKQSSEEDEFPMQEEDYRSIFSFENMLAMHREREVWRDERETLLREVRELKEEVKAIAKTTI
jgi:hypothetical protein